MTKIPYDLTQAENSPGAAGHRWECPLCELFYVTAERKIVTSQFSSVNKFPKVQNQKFPGFLKARVQTWQSLTAIASWVSDQSQFIIKVEDFTRTWVWLFSLKSSTTIFNPHLREQGSLPAPPSSVR